LTTILHRARRERTGQLRETPTERAGSSRSPQSRHEIGRLPHARLFEIGRVTHPFSPCDTPPDDDLPASRSR
jgi:hypothetical protein